MSPRRDNTLGESARWLTPNSYGTAGIAPSVQCPAACTSIAVTERGCGWRLAAYYKTGDADMCHGPKCPRWPKAMRKVKA